MTKQEAKELYLNSDCSYFTMCTKYYAGYIEYRHLELPKSQEREWKNDKIQMLCTEMKTNGDDQLFRRLYEIAVDFRDYEKLRQLLDALRELKQPLTPKQRINISEIILGRKVLKARSGLIYWAYDIGQRGIAILLMDCVLEYIHFPEASDKDKELKKQIQKYRRICKKIIEELHLNFSNRYLSHYYNF